MFFLVSFLLCRLLRPSEERIFVCFGTILNGELCATCPPALLICWLPVVLPLSPVLSTCAYGSLHGLEHPIVACTRTLRLPIRLVLR
jgi:hypothetical protein